MTTIPMTRPSGGCDNCGGEVRTWKTGYGWTCAKCVRLLEREASPRQALNALRFATDALHRAAGGQTAAEKFGLRRARSRLRLDPP
jgi:hypothetical protein